MTKGMDFIKIFGEMTQGEKAIAEVRASDELKLMWLLKEGNDSGNMATPQNLEKERKINFY